MDNMLSNALRSIVDLARIEVYKQVHSTASEITYLDMQHGITKTVAKAPTPISHTILDLDSLIRMIIEQNANDTSDEASQIATFVSPTEVITILDYSTYRVNLIKVPLVQSSILHFLSRSFEGSPKEAIRALKYNLKSAHSGLQDVIPALTTLKFESSSTAEHNNRPTDEGVSQSLKSKVTGSAEIPEEFEVMFDIYPSMAGELRDGGDLGVKMELHVDPSEGTVSFRPFPGAIDAAIIQGAEMVRSEIERRLAEKLLTEISEMVFLGKP